MAVQDVLVAIKQQEQGEGPWRQALRRLLRRRLALVCLAIIAVLYLAGIFASLLAPSGFNEQNFKETLQGPSASHWFGTDRLGRDQFTRVLYGLRTTVIVTFLSVITGSLLLGITLGLMSGYVGGKVDTVIMRIGEIFLAFPGLLFVIMLAATVKPRVIDWFHSLEDATGIKGLVSSGIPDYLVVFTALAIVSWVGMARLVRGQVLSLKSQDFVLAAQSIGAGFWHIVWRHLFPNTLSQIIVVVSMGLGAAAGSEVALSFLGLGIQPPNPSLGTMISAESHISVLRVHPYLLLIPSAMVGLLLFCWNIVGDALNDALNPKTQ
ncbi:MAG: ABC transporter permease [Chloroflexi bacterium]|nr:ABC transporter permease [Chloroflexota bacterium]